MPDNIQDDIRAAIESSRESSKEGSTVLETGHDDFAPQVSETLPPVMPEGKELPTPKEESALPPRGPDGKFLPTQQPAPLGSPAAPVEPEDSVRFDPAKPPAAWTQQMKDKWNSIPEDIRQEITRREEASAAGVQKLMQQTEGARTLFGSMQEYVPYFNDIGMQPGPYLHTLINMEQTMRLGNPAQKIDMLLELADFYGVPIRDALDSAMGGTLGTVLEEAHKHHQTPAQLPPAIQQELMQRRQWQEQVESMAATNELEFFAQQPGHEYLEHVRDDMADLIESGVVEGYQDAYDLACWRNPQIRAAVQAQSAGQAQLNGVQQRQRAAAGVVAPQGAPLVQGGDVAAESDDLYTSVRKAWNNAVSGGV